MKKFLLSLIILVLSHAASSGYAYAQQVSGDRLEALFTINGIEVDERAVNASIARSQAISKAESIAFDKLKSKLVALDDLHLLANTDFMDIRSLVRGIEVSDERAFSNRYMARINITFSPDAIIDIFTKAGASFILNAGSEVCVAHAHKQGLITRLWEADNRTKAIWQTADIINRLRTYKVAKGTLKERMALDTKAVEVGGFEAADTFAKGCGTGAGLIIFTHAITDQINAGTNLQYKYWISDMLTAKEGILHAVESDEGFDRGVNDGVDVLLALLINQILEDSDESWRQTAMVKGDEKAEILFLLHTDKITSLASAQQKLETLSVVSDVRIMRVAIPLSQLRVSYTGSHEQLVQSLNQIGYSLEAWGQENLLVPVK